LGVPRRKRSGHLDEIAATVILQSYLDAQEKA
jgi:RNase H-fold protein (predicted Holliday junction resolvase)